MVNQWILHVKKVAKQNNISYKEALSVAKLTYKKKKKIIKGGYINDLTKKIDEVLTHIYTVTVKFYSELKKKKKENLTLNLTKKKFLLRKISILNKMRLDLLQEVENKLSSKFNINTSNNYHQIMIAINKEKNKRKVSNIKIENLFSENGKLSNIYQI